MSDYARGIRMPGLFHLLLFDEGKNGRHDCHLAHRHDFFEIFWITRGRGRVHCDLRSYDFHPGILFGVSPGQVHSWTVDEPVEGRIVSFSRKFFAMDSAHPGFLGKLPFLCAPSGPMVVEVEPVEAPFLDGLFSLLWEAARVEDSVRPERVRAYLVIILSLARQVFNRQNRPYQDAHDTKLAQRFRVALDENFPRLLRVSDYASLLAVSRSHLNDNMIRHVGRTASEIIHERIELEAKRLLVHSMLTVSEIAYQLQFRDPSYFVRFFKRRTQLTPGDYRARFALVVA
jgi:AraC family transcriptional activator of pobA